MSRAYHKKSCVDTIRFYTPARPVVAPIPQAAKNLRFFPFIRRLPSVADGPGGVYLSG
jgi:hypothetical protein